MLRAPRSPRRRVLAFLLTALAGCGEGEPGSPSSAARASAPRAPELGDPDVDGQAAAGEPQQNAAAVADRAATFGEAPEFSADDLHFFEERIRPLFHASCHRCHGPERERVKGGLRLASRAALLAGGDLGPAVVPGDPDGSLLVRAVRWEGELQMPPDGRLGADEVRDLEAWVRRGAPWPGGAPLAERTDEPGIDVAAGRDWWSFRPVEDPPVPALADAAPGEVRDPLDAFVLARLADAGLEPNPAAAERELVRRAYVDLIGLPPTFEELEAYVADPDPDKWSRLVDELLARDEYGQRWASWWLDLVRFAQTNGYERDSEKPAAWRYRDWVVDALNDDLPYDEFLRHQLAGDELDEPTAASRIATGFYRVGAWDREPDDREQAIFDELDDFVRVVGEGFLGLTIGCARCHDHKFDPISQDDYTGLVALFRNVRPYEVPRFALDSATLAPAGADADALAAWERAREARRAELQATADRLLGRAPGDPPRPLKHAIQGLDKETVRAFARAKAELDDLDGSFEGALDWALVVREKGTELEPTRLLARGQATSPLAVVPPHFPRVLCADDASAHPTLRPRPDVGSSGARSALADWIVDPGNPLTARVIVNRVWQQHFGRGLVPTPNDFGRSGQAPTHPALLDHLATTLVRDGWSLKRLHRRILSSATWRRSSRATNAVALERDPENELWWRQGLRRLEAEALHDALLWSSGELDPAPGGRGFFPRLSAQALAGMSRPGKGWGRSSPGERARRAVHAFVKRGMLVPFFTTFDYGEATLPIGRRFETNIATQAMMLLNSEFANERAAALADRLLAASGGRALDATAVEHAWRRVLGRRPRPDERALALDYLRATAADYAVTPLRLVFRPRVPARIDTGFLELARGADLLLAPRRDWTCVQGRYGNYYNGTFEADPVRGPLALCEPSGGASGAADLELHAGPGLRVARIVLGARADEEGAWTGLALAFDFVAGEVRCDRVGGEEPEPDDPPEPLARWPLELPRETALALRLEWSPDALSAQLTGPGPDPLRWSANLATGPPDGRLGVGVSGGELELLGALDVDGRPYDLARAIEGDVDPERRALESLCLALFNLNEFLYVD